MRPWMSPFLTLLAPALVAQSGWSTPAFVTELNSTAADSAPQIAADGLTMHFASFVTGNWEIWSATRPARGVPFGAPVHEAALGSTFTESGPFLRADGLEILFESTTTSGAGGFDILRATRATTASPWGTPTLVTELNSTGSEAAASMTDDGTELYLLSTSFGAPYAPNNSIFVARRAGASGPFGTPTLVAELAATQGSTDSHRDVEISGDGLRIVFTRTDAVTRRLNVYMATRTSRARPFKPPVVLGEFASTGTATGVFSASVSADGNEMFLAAGFAAAAGGQEIMVSRFDGLTTRGVASTTAAMDLYYRDAAAAGRPYACALSGGNGGFALGARTVPLDLDGIFIGSLGQDIAGLSTGFLGTLDAAGEAHATLRNPAPFLIGIHVFVGAFTFDPVAPFGVRTISNAVEVELQ